jgi:hypothetical protein
VIARYLDQAQLRTTRRVPAELARQAGADICGRPPAGPLLRCESFSRDGWRWLIREYDMARLLLGPAPLGPALHQMLAYCLPAIGQQWAIQNLTANFGTPAV